MPRTDELIKKDVTDELVRDIRVDASQIEVTVANGVIALKGYAPTYLGRSAATECALSVLGVAEVSNQIVVRYPETAAVPTDSEIETTIREKLAANPDIDLIDLIVSVDAGAVTLKGTVDAYWKKAYAEMLVAPEPGVTMIENHLAVTPTEEVIDRDIANDIMASLEARAAVDAENVDVSVVNGTVTLSGMVRDWVARRAADDAALYTAGVVRVDNNLEVARV